MTDDKIHDGLLTYHLSKFHSDADLRNPKELRLIMRLDFFSLKGGNGQRESIAVAQRSSMDTPEFENEMVRQMKMQLKSMLLNIMQTGKIGYEDADGEYMEKTIDAVLIGEVLL